LEELSVHYLNNILVGVESQYSSPAWEVQAGAKILSVPRNKEIQCQTFKIGGTTFQSIEVGYDGTDSIGYLKITSK